MDLAQLDTLAQRASACTACRLSETRTQVVWGSGSESARLVLVGEAPGKQEDLGGEPFIGAAGKVLDGVLAEAGLSRNELYICNTVKCRPPENRNPRTDEVAACAQWLDAQLDAISPAVVVALGAVASARLIGQTAPMASLRGTTRTVGGRMVLSTFHPAAVIYDRTKRPLLMEDFMSVRALLDRAAPDRASSL